MRLSPFMSFHSMSPVACQFRIQTGARWGMVTLDAHLLALYERHIISYEDVITKAQDPDGIAQKLQAGLQKK